MRHSAKDTRGVPAVMSRMACLDRSEGADEFYLEQLSKLTLSPLLFRVRVCYFYTSAWPNDYSLERTFKWFSLITKTVQAHFCKLEKYREAQIRHGSVCNFSMQRLSLQMQLAHVM